MEREMESSPVATNQLRVIRGKRRLTPEEVARDRAIRREVYAEYPSLRMIKYRELESKLALMRRGKEGEESAEEDAVLDEMDRIWGKLTVEERDVLSQDSPKPMPSRSVESKTT